jgi:cyclic dehypoxanthinyl futalosine synthase
MTTDFQSIYSKALQLEAISEEEANMLYTKAPLPELMFVANEIRKKLHPENVVTWIIDRNVNITNVCTSGCLFCNFHCAPQSGKAYITSIEEYDEKIEVLFAQGGEQLLLQGGMHPELGLDKYEELFRTLKKRHPKLKLHALGPPEVVYLSKKSGLSYRETLQRLINAGLDSLPGAGAEILVDEVRSKISKNKCNAKEWLDAMHEAHNLNLATSATMMLGHIETSEQRIEHLIKIRDLQSRKQEGTIGFLSFIPWPFQGENTALVKKHKELNTLSPTDYIRFIAISRIVLNNIPNIQASWLTVGTETAQICLHSGANDMGSIMIEENVVSVAGANHQLDAERMQQKIREAGFEPKRRNQQFAVIS